MYIENKMVRSILKTDTFRQSQITILGTLVNGVLGALFYILVARFLGPSDFGLLIVSITTLTLISDVVDFGANTGLVKFVSENINKDRNKSLEFLKLSLEFKFCIWILVLLIGWFLSPFISVVIFKKIELIVPLRLVMIGVGGALLLSFATSALQAFQRYFVWSLVNITTNLIRLLIILTLFSLGRLNLLSGLFSYILLPFLGFSISLYFLPFKQIFKIKNEFSVARQLFKYNLWIGTFTIITAVSSRLDTFLTARLLSTFELGIYGAVNQLVQIIPQLVGALGIVAAPKFASFTNNMDMISYLKKFQLFVLGLSLVGLFAIPISFFLIPKIFGIQYSQAIGPFIILLVAMLVFLISVPIHNSIIFYFGRPDIFVWTAIGHLLIMTTMGYFLISGFGIFGAANTVLVGMLFNFIAPLCWLLFKLKNENLG